MKFGKGKASLKPELPITKQEIPFLKTPDVSTQVTVSEAKEAWKRVDMFLQQQITAGLARRNQKDLENRIYGLESQLEK